MLKGEKLANNSLIVINKPKKLFLVVPGLNIGGRAIWVKTLKEGLPKISQDKVRVITLNYFEAARWPIVIRDIILFGQALSRGRFCDVFLTLDAFDSIGPVSWAAKILKKPLWLKLTSENMWLAINNPIKKKSLIKLTKDLEKIIVPSKNLKDDIIRWGVEGNKVVVIAEAFELPFGLEERSRLRSKWKVAGQFIFGAGRLVSRKNFDQLVRAMPSVLEKFPDAKLLIAGGGSEQASLEELIKSLHLSDNVMLAGVLSQEDLFIYLRMADLFVSPGSYENGSLMLLEASVMGTPALATDVGDNKDIASQVVAAGDPDKLAEAIKNMLSGVWRNPELGKERLSIERMVISYLRLLLKK